jgi:hypothetical protein
VDMSLSTFGDAFTSEEFQARASEYPVVAFVLAAAADENVFPREELDAAFAPGRGCGGKPMVKLPRS